MNVKHYSIYYGGREGGLFGLALLLAGGPALTLLVEPEARYIRVVLLTYFFLCGWDASYSFRGLQLFLESAGAFAAAKSRYVCERDTFSEDKSGCRGSAWPR